MNGSAKAPVHLWIVGILSLLWNGFGGFDYIMTQSQNEAYLAPLTQECRDYFAAYPIWMDSAWAIGVWAAALGSVLLLVRSRHSVPVFILSLAGLAISTLYQYVLTVAPAPLRAAPMVAFTALLWAVAIGLILYAQRMRARGVLR